MTVVIHGTQGIDTPDLDVTGVGSRINADFSNVTPNNRVTFQTNQVNAHTIVGAMPSGTNITSMFRAWGGSDLSNTSFADIRCDGVLSKVISGRSGAGTFLPLTFETNDAERMRITTDGRVGIGVDPIAVSSPAKFTIDGGIVSRATGGGEGGEIALKLPDNSADGLLMDVLSSTEGRIFTGQNNFAINIGQLVGTGGQIGFFTDNGTLKAAINQSGSAASTLRLFKNNPSVQGNCHLELKSSAGDVKLSLHAEGATACIIKHIRGGSGFLVANDIDSAFAPIAASAFNINSDYRLKENVVPMTGALARAMQLRPCTFTWKADGSYGEGFIAHQLQEVVPIAVTGKKDAMLESGEPDYQGVDAAKIVALLTAALQELAHEVDSLRMEVKMLKGAQQ